MEDKKRGHKVRTTSLQWYAPPNMKEFGSVDPEFDDVEDFEETVRERLRERGEL